jgi:hypothetical protein
MVGLSYLQHTFNLSDEAVVQRKRCSGRTLHSHV